jgi:hypothetical protein
LADANEPAEQRGRVGGDAADEVRPPEQRAHLGSMVAGSERRSPGTVPVPLM